MKTLGKVFTALIALSISHWAIAAEARILEEIIVTAMKRESPMQEVPIAVTALTERMLQRAGVLDLGQLSTLAASFNLDTSTTESQGTTLRLRGVGTSGNNIGLESAVGVFLDGVYLSRPGIALTDLADVEQVEVLRGPQGTLFGRNTNAGVVSIRTKKPNMVQDEFYADFTAGNFDAYNMQLGASGPLIEDTLGYRISGALRQRDGFLDSVSGAESHNRDRWQIRGQLQWQINDRANLRLIADYADAEDLCCDGVLEKDTAAVALGSYSMAGLPAHGGGSASGRKAFKDRVSNSDQFENPFEQTGFSAELNMEITDDINMTYLGAWREFDTFGVLDTDYVSLDVFAVRPEAAAGYDTGDFIDSITHELRFNGRVGRLDWLVGAYYSDEDIEEQQGLGLGTDFAAYVDANLWNFAFFPVLGVAQGLAGIPLATGGTFGDVLAAPSPTLAFAGGLNPAGAFAQNNFHQDSKSWSIFTHNTLELTDSLDLVLGLRWTDEEKDGSFRQLNASNPACFNTLANAVALSAGAAGTGLEAVAADLGNFSAGFVCFPFATPADTGVPILPSSFDETFKDDEFIYDLTAVYEFTDRVNGYLSYSHGYKSGGFNLDSTAAVAGASPSFDSENIDSLEFGLKSEWFNRLLRANFAAWIYDIEDFQVLEFTGIQFTTFNVPKADSEGYELELLSSPIEGLEISAAYMHAETSYPSDCDDNNPNASPLVSSLCRSKFINSPENVITAGLSFDGYINNNLSYFLAANARWEDDRRTIVQPTAGFDIQEANTKVNLRAGIGSPSGSWTLEVWGSNITDKRTRNLTVATPLRLDSHVTFLEAPRTYGVTLRTRF